MTWLPGVNVVDLSGTRGNGPFGQFLGVILHVNQGDTFPSFYASQEVCPNFQVHKDGSIDQLLPLNWQPWCQSDGNTNYAAIETSGYTTEPLTDAQVQSCAVIIAAYVQQMGMSPVLAEVPGQAGFGWHGMGGINWGGHPDCPGDQRKAQRTQILSIATGQAPHGGGTPIPAPVVPLPLPEGDPMWKDAVIFKIGDGPAVGQYWLLLPDGRYFGIQNGTELNAYKALGAVTATGDTAGASLSSGGHRQFLAASPNYPFNNQADPNAAMPVKA